MDEELLTVVRIAERLGISTSKVSKVIRERGLQPDQKKGNCGYYGGEKVEQIKQAVKAE